MIQHVFERARHSGALDVIIATDDERIRQTAEQFGATVRMTSPEHRSGTERVAEAVHRLKEPEDRIVVNLQGDEPLIPPAIIGQVAEDLADHPHADVTTLCEPIESHSALFNPNVVKVVCDHEGNALYFSRAPIPWHREHFSKSTSTLPGEAVHYRHIGVYAYRVGYLRRYVQLPACQLERIEGLEQLRVLHHGGRIHVATALEPPGPGVDTLQDLEHVRSVMSGL